MAISFDLKAHDAQFHPDGYKPGVSKCKFRDEMDKYASVDDLSQTQNIVDALEDSELLESMMGAALDDETKNQLQGQLKASGDILAKILGKTPDGGVPQSSAPAVAQFGPNAPLPHDDSGFPKENDADWQDKLANYGDPSYGWQSVGSGSTLPHSIAFNGKTYFVKKAGENPTYSVSAAKNEANANNFLRLAGLNAPDSAWMFGPNRKDVFCVSQEADLSGGTLASNLGNRNVGKQVREAYPVMSLLYNMDLMQNSDNAFVDGNGNPVYLDNGSTFGFSARGDRNKRIDFDKRDDPLYGDPDFVALANYRGNTSGERWRKVLNGGHAVDMDTALKEAAKYDMGALVRKAQSSGLLDHLPQKGVDSLIIYADRLDGLSAKYRKTPVAKPASATSASGASGQPADTPQPATAQTSGGSATPMFSATPISPSSPASPSGASAAPVGGNGAPVNRAALRIQKVKNRKPRAAATQQSTPQSASAPAPTASSQPSVADPTTAPAQPSAPTNAKGKLSPKAAARLQRMMGQQGIPQSVQSAYQQMLAAGGVTPSAATNAQTVQAIPVPQQPPQQPAPLPVAAPSPAPAANGKYAKAMARLNNMMANPNATQSQKAMWQAMANRLASQP